MDNSREYITIAVFFILLIWGPIDYSWPGWFLIRLGYLVLIPLATWFLLKLIWSKWQPDFESEDRLMRTLLGVTSGVFLVMAIREATADTHISNTLVVRSKDVYEEIGDYIVEPGPDWEKVLFYLWVFLFLFCFSFIKHEKY